MVYQWKIPSLYPVSAEVAGTELDRIYEKNGELKQEAIVEESRPETAPLHPIFEWDDKKAADKYRKEQATHLMCALVQVEERKEQPPKEIQVSVHKEKRAFTHAEKAYHPTRVVLEHPTMRDEAFRDVIRSIESFKQKFSIYNEVAGIIVEMDKVLERNKAYSA